jgi:hypothetical protein
MNKILRHVIAGAVASAFAASLIACGMGSSVEADSAQASEVRAAPIPPGAAVAAGTVESFFAHLNAGRWAEAAQLYGGDYEILTQWNPDVDPNDHAALWMHGCTHNGLLCVKVKRVVRVTEVALFHYRFTVEFERPESHDTPGNVLVIDDCCMGPKSKADKCCPTTEFDYDVVSTNGGPALVLQKPVWGGP